MVHGVVGEAEIGAYYFYTAHQVTACVACERASRKEVEYHAAGIPVLAPMQSYKHEPWMSIYLQTRDTRAPLRSDYGLELACGLRMSALGQGADFLLRPLQYTTN